LQLFDFLSELKTKYLQKKPKLSFELIIMDFAPQHPAKLRFENTINKKTRKRAWRFFF
jgi:hypothetical protein